MLNELITSPSSGWIDAVGNLVFLDASDYDYGASWYYSYNSVSGNRDGYYTANNPKPDYTPIYMRDGSRVTLGNTANRGVVGDGQDYNLRVDHSRVAGCEFFRRSQHRGDDGRQRYERRFQDLEPVDHDPLRRPDQQSAVAVRRFVFEQHRECCGFPGRQYEDRQ